MKRLNRSLIVGSFLGMLVLCFAAWLWPWRWIIPTTKRIRGVSPGGAIMLPR